MSPNKRPFHKMPGLVVQPLKSGNGYRYRVRQSGNPRKMITVCHPDDRDFLDQYHAARQGMKPEVRREKTREDKTTLQYVMKRSLEIVEEEVGKGTRSKDTLRTYASAFKRFSKVLGSRPAPSDVSTSAMFNLRERIEGSANARNKAMKCLRMAYNMGIERGYCKNNPVIGLKPLEVPPPQGAIPWTREEVNQYLDYWKKGTKQNLIMHLLYFTACRVGDVIKLGPGNEVVKNGERYLEFQPSKKGSAFVSIPMHPQLIEAIRAMPVRGLRYLLQDNGRPYTGENNMSITFINWAAEAGLKDRSAHGVRKMCATYLAEDGNNLTTIGAWLGHKNESTTQVYTKTARVQKLTAETTLRGIN